MTHTIEVEIDELGKIRPMNPTASLPPGRALLVWNAEADHETALLSEASLSIDWLKPEEDETWAHMQSNRTSSPAMSKFQIGPNGLPILPSRGIRLTPEMVKALSEEELG